MGHVEVEVRRRGLARIAQLRDRLSPSHAPARMHPHAALLQVRTQQVAMGRTPQNHVVSGDVRERHPPRQQWSRVVGNTVHHLRRLAAHRSPLGTRRRLCALLSKRLLEGHDWMRSIRTQCIEPLGPVLPTGRRLQVVSPRRIRTQASMIVPFEEERQQRPSRPLRRRPTSPTLRTPRAA